MYSSPDPRSGSIRKVTVPDLRERKRRGPPIAALTCYDFLTAKLLDEAGVDIVLVGDSVGMVFQGLPTTLPVTLDEICYHGRAVARGVRRAHLVGDMPFMTFQVSPEQAVASAGKMLKEGSFEAVKIEGGEPIAEHVRRIVAVGIPVMAHVGLTPQSVHAFGGFRVQGKSEDAAKAILDGARALEQAGAYAIVLEAIPADLAARITEELTIPTIGIGAGAACDGQILVCTDMLGLSRQPGPKFVKRYAEIGALVVEAAKAYVSEVEARAFPDEAHSPRPAVNEDPAVAAARRVSPPS